jgi:hypothetical protein
VPVVTLTPPTAASSSSASASSSAADGGTFGGRSRSASRLRRSWDGDGGRLRGTGDLLGWWTSAGWPGPPAARHLVEDVGQLQQRLERHARRALIHPGTGHRVAHPARQLAQSPRLILDQDDVGAPAARAFTQTKPPTE